MSHRTGNPRIDSILWGGQHWPSGGGSTTNLTYYFDNTISWLTTEKIAYKAALQSWANVAKLSFTEVFSASSANFVERVVLKNVPTNIDFSTFEKSKN